MRPGNLAIPAVYVRGGTSRAVVFKRDDLPADRRTWPDIFRAVLGSPDPESKQLDGLGGGITSLSKIAVLAPSTREGIDVDYFFAQIDPKSGAVLLGANCGNISSAIGPYAVDEGWVLPGHGETVVRIFNENTCTRIIARFDHDAPTQSFIAISGVAGQGAPVSLTFEHPGGSMVGETFPTGHMTDDIRLPDGQTLAATLIDVSIPCVIANADAFGLRGDESYSAMAARADITQRLADVRCAAAIAMGCAKTWEEAQSTYKNVPDVVLVSRLDSTQTGIRARFYSCDQPHRAAPVTSAMALAAAACIPGTVAHAAMRTSMETRNTAARATGIVDIHHPSGVMRVEADVDPNDGQVLSTSILRTARRIMEGRVLVPAYLRGIAPSQGACAEHPQ
ncbi:PrpF domain-containing protein [Pandoraea anhela]|uniref:PrpF protein n=1 Tax=Pandoraea anhela TaxID=2508295 RepID=A0A5E4W804_9BURK|nr:PrpF domain-containing protein [Pandoraea anhela]VVE20541.1 PrpF protein [Pandoraea anhela]